MYKSKLPFVLVFNKTDVQSPQFAMDWMQDFEKFQQALAAGNATDPSEQARGGGDSASFRARGEEPSYMNSLMNSMSLVLDEFYGHLKVRSDVIHEWRFVDAASGRWGLCFDG